ncbi:MAG: hypothetical protein ONB42_04880 [candidate division KSB1 bacterium]|nr:hypothetical protein [candidate division KSB1 bacterium]MDZ7313378.1 hypothetical protein [candidate division KSB1 bacterium]
MAYKAIDAKVKVDAVKQYWATGNISQISKKTGSSRATIYSWIAFAENALVEAFGQIHPGPRRKSLQHENEILKTQLKKLYDKYHKESRPRPLTAPEDAPPQICTDCGSAQIRKNGTVPFKRRGTCQRYTCRHCSLSIYVVLKKTT